MQGLRTEKIKVTSRRQQRAVIGAVVLALFAVSGCNRKDDYTFNSSRSTDGTWQYTFTSSLAPALPNAPIRAVDFEEILSRIGLDEYSLSVAVNNYRDYYQWRTQEGETVRVGVKLCSDNISCVDYVQIKPPQIAVMRNLAAQNSNQMFIESSNYVDWPFIVDFGVIRCDPPGAITFTSQDQVYAMNGLAHRSDRPLSTEIQKQINGRSVTSSSIWRAAHNLCN